MKTIVEGDVEFSNDTSIEIRVDTVHLVGSAPVAAGDVVEARTRSRHAERIEVGTRVVARINEASDQVLALTSSKRVVCTAEPTSTIPLAVFIDQHQNGDGQQCEDVVASDPGYQEAPCDVGLYCSATAGTVSSRLGAWLPVTVVLAFMFLLGRRRTVIKGVSRDPEIS